MFNEGGYVEKVESGELWISNIVDVGPSPPSFPIGSRSQMVEYQTLVGVTVAWVHQDGDKFGNPAEGSSPDPKFLFNDGVRYKPSPLAPSPPLGGLPSQPRSRARRRR